jgi:hypothetical protein
MRRLLQIVFFFEVGFVLAVVPWSQYWERNYFADSFPLLHEIITNNFVRGAITGLGLVNVAVGVLELISVFIARRDDSIVTIGHHGLRDADVPPAED